MKVSAIYRILFFLFIGFAAGIAAGGSAATRIILNNMPPTQEISIGKQKIRGRGNTLDTVLAPVIENTETVELTRKEKRKIRRQTN